MEYNISTWIILNWTCASKYNYQYNSQCLQKLETNKIESWQISAFIIDFILNIVIHTPLAVETIHAGMDANHFVTLIVSILYILVVFINISLFYNNESLGTNIYFFFNNWVTAGSIWQSHPLGEFDMIMCSSCQAASPVIIRCSWQLN